MSLLEVVIALGIFLGTFAVISQIVNTGARAAMEAQAEHEATVRAERILGEVLAGALPFQSAGPTPFEEDNRWTWTVEVLDGPHADLRQLIVTAARQRSDGVIDTQVSLTRYARVPQVFVDAAALSTSSE